MNYLKRNINKNTLWIDTTGTGLAVAEYLKSKGIQVNTFTLTDQSALQQRLNCGSRENQKQNIKDG